MNTRTVPEIIDAFGGQAAFGRIIDKSASTASEMKRRGSIPAGYWPMIIKATTVDGVPVTLEELAEAHRSRVVRSDEEIRQEHLARAWDKAPAPVRTRFLTQVGLSERRAKELVAQAVEAA